MAKGFKQLSCLNNKQDLGKGREQPSAKKGFEYDYKYRDFFITLKYNERSRTYKAYIADRKITDELDFMRDDDLTYAMNLFEMRDEDKDLDRLRARVEQKIDDYIACEPQDWTELCDALVDYAHLLDGYIDITQLSKFMRKLLVNNPDLFQAELQQLFAEQG